MARCTHGRRNISVAFFGTAVCCASAAADIRPDFNGDGFVDLDDFGAFKAAFHDAQGLGAAAVPEASSLTLLLLGVLLVPLYRLRATTPPLQTVAAKHGRNRRVFRGSRH